MNEVNRFSLSELNNLIGTTLKEQLEGFFWVVAEINHINENRSGHCYLELIEKSVTGDQVLAAAKAIIWAAKYRFIRAYFEQITGEPLKAGLKIMVRVSVEYHTVYGLSFIVSDIDAAYTLGEAARRRNETINKLTESGVIDMNKSLLLPTVIKEIAIISSRGAAGYEDFINQLFHNPYKYQFNVGLFEATMQGNETERTVIEAMNAIFLGKKKYDVVAIIRGGGSKSDLAAFDNYNIAYYITQFPIPVLSGIGHERDDTVSDIVAHTRLKTPTATADFIIDHNRRFEENITTIYESLIEKSEHIIRDHFSLIHYFSLSLIQKAKAVSDREKRKQNIVFQNLNKHSMNLLLKSSGNLNAYMHNIKTNSGYFMILSKNKLEISTKQMQRSTENYISRMNEKIGHYSKSVEIARPENILKHGFSITRFENRAILSAKNIKPGQILTTQFSDGTISSKVESEKLKVNK